MTVEFGAASAWWLLAIVPVVWLAASRWASGLVLRPGLPHVVLRSLLLASLTAALSQPVLVRSSDRLAIVYLVDVSDSVASGAWTHAADVIDRLNAALRPARSHILAFAGSTAAIPDTAALRAMSVDRAVPAEIGRVVRPEVTDLEQALIAAQAAIDPGAGGRIVVLSDGRETRGDAERAARRLAAAGIPVSVEPVPVRSLDDTWIEDVRVPRPPLANTAAAVEVVIGTQGDTDVDIAVREGARTIATHRAAIPRGRSTVSLDVPMSSPGAHLIETTVTARRNALAENDTFLREIIVAPPMRVLMVQAEGGDASPAPLALARAGIAVTVARPDELPATPAPLRQFDVVVLSNIARARLSADAMTALGTWVQDDGGGLLFAGGDAVVGESADQTHAGYRRSEIERVLPVTFDRDDEPDVALVIVLDRSWSMFGAAMDLSKAAAEAAAGTLTAAQMVGVLSFNDNAEWNVPLARVRDTRATLHDAIQRIAASGPTAIYPALEYAYDALAAVRARAKHVILLSDGQTAAKDFEGLVRRMQRARITVSSVALGPEADVTLLRNIALWGGGRNYVVENATQIPEIFVKEARNAANSTNGDDDTIRPVSRQEAYLSAAGGELPALTGRNVVSRKPGSVELLGTTGGDPLLAFWHAGLGRAAMFAADIDGRWTKSWVAWPGFQAALSTIVRSLASRPPASAVLDVVPDDSAGAEAHLRVTLDRRDEDGVPRDLLSPEVEVRRRDARARLRLMQTGPGHYEGRLTTGASDPVFVTLMPPSEALTRIVVPDPAAEYRFGPVDESRLAAMAAETGGVVRPAPEDLGRARPGSGTRRQPLVPWCLGLALVLWPIDIALRRLWRYAAHSTAAADLARR